jgi:type I restriction enzyme S subunit
MSVLPTGWTKATIGDVIVPFQTLDPTKTPNQIFQYIDIGSIDNVTMSIRDAKKFLGSNAPSRARRVIQDGDTLLSTVRTYLKNIALVPRSRSGQLTSTGIAVLRPGSAVDPNYLFRWTSSDAFIGTLSEAQDGTMYPAVSDADVSASVILLPPLREQRRIVAKVDSLTAKSKRARDHLEHIPRLVEKYKQAILAAAYRGDLTRDWRGLPENRAERPTLAAVRKAREVADLPPRRKTALTALPKPPPIISELPPNWERICVEELSSDAPRSIQSGPFGSQLLHSEFQDEGVLAIGIDNVRDGSFSLGSEHRISEEKHQALSKFEARPGDVLVTVMATIGRTCVVPDDIGSAIITKHVYRITIDRRLALPAFLMNALRGCEVVLEQLGANVRGQTRPGINGEILKSLYLPLPPLSEQLVILQRIDTAFAWINRLAANATSARKLVDKLDQAVLAKAFRGELVPQDPNDEPASVLLDRIRAERASKPKAKRGRKPGARP